MGKREFWKTFDVEPEYMGELVLVDKEWNVSGGVYRGGGRIRPDGAAYMVYASEFLLWGYRRELFDMTNFDEAVAVADDEIRERSGDE